MLPDQVSNPGPLTYESGALPIALRGPANVLRNSVKSHLNMNPEQSSEFQDPSSSNYLHILLTRFSIVIKAKSKQGYNSTNVLQNSLKS